jgi:hypothetical protein
LDKYHLLAGLVHKVKVYLTFVEMVKDDFVLQLMRKRDRAADLAPGQALILSLAGIVSVWLSLFIEIPRRF